MLKEFSVENFKNFKEKIIVDLSKVREYTFNAHLIKNNLINKMLIYGANNSGKSNLGTAMMNITTHLTDKLSDNGAYVYSINGNSDNLEINYSYVFKFNDKELKYCYSKNYLNQLVKEELKVEDNIIFKYDYLEEKYVNNIEEALTIDISKRTNKEMSVLKYIYANTLYFKDESPVKLLFDFVNNMLWFRSLRSNEFMGGLSNGEDLDDFIINNGLVKDFENFLRECKQDYTLCEIIENGKKTIGVEYANYKARFSLVASSGILSLWLFYFWMNRTENISFIYLDEFDTFYNFELSEYILNYVNNKTDFQTILTSHNTYLIDNELMRPDCYAKLEDGALSSFANRTDKTIRQGHNLEKMMLSNEF